MTFTVCQEWWSLEREAIEKTKWTSRPADEYFRGLKNAKRCREWEAVSKSSERDRTNQSR